MTSNDAKKLREYINLSIEELSSELKLENQEIIDLENGTKPITKMHELALKYLLISNSGIYHFPWRSNKSN